MRPLPLSTWLWRRSWGLTQRRLMWMVGLLLWATLWEPLEAGSQGTWCMSSGEGLFELNYINSSLYNAKNWSNVGFYSGRKTYFEMQLIHKGSNIHSTINSQETDWYWICFSFSRRRKAKYAIGSACIGGGQGISLLLENCHWQQTRTFLLSAKGSYL